MTLVAEPNGYAPQTPQVATGCDPEPAAIITYFSKIFVNVIFPYVVSSAVSHWPRACLTRIICTFLASTILAILCSAGVHPWSHPLPPDPRGSR